MADTGPGTVGGMRQPNEAMQQHIARLLLDAVADAGFALAGAGAVRAHGVITRPTYDVDLFTEPLISEHDFRAAVTAGEVALRAAGYRVIELRITATFARLNVQDTSGHSLDVDFAPNWRADPPVRMDVGPVLSERDAVAGKLSAVYSRGEVRDFLDLDSIGTSGRYTDADLLALGREHDDGFDPPCSPTSSPASQASTPRELPSTASPPQSSTPPSSARSAGQPNCARGSTAHGPTASASTRPLRRPSATTASTSEPLTKVVAARRA